MVGVFLYSLQPDSSLQRFPCIPLLCTDQPQETLSPTIRRSDVTYFPLYQPLDGAILLTLNVFTDCNDALREPHIRCVEILNNASLPNPPPPPTIPHPHPPHTLFFFFLRFSCSGSGVIGLCCAVSRYSASYESYYTIISGVSSGAWSLRCRD